MSRGPRASGEPGAARALGAPASAARAALPGLFAAAVLAGACAREPSPPPAEVMTISRVAVSYLDRPDLWSAASEPQDHPVRANVMSSPLRSGAAVPGLEMTPPCEVTLELPALPERAVLHFLAGAPRETWEGRGEATFEIASGAASLWSRTISVGPEVPVHERAWVEGRLTVTGPGALTLRTRWQGAAGGEPAGPLGFAALEVRVPLEVARARSSPDAPNVVLILVDTLRADRLGAYGNAAGLSPHLDALAAKGTLFERAYAPAPWTSPSTASILTGLDPPAHGLGFAESIYLVEGLVTLPEVLQERGFSTGAFSANPLIGSDRNWDQGFESFQDGSWTPSEDFLPDVLAWLEANASRRFFLYLHLVDPHAPYQPRAPFSSRVGPRPEGWSDEMGRTLTPRIVAGESFPPGWLERVAAYLKSAYDGEVASADAAIGAVLDRLEALSLADRTVVAVTADHGEEFGEHGLFGHVSQLHEELLHVPLILTGPRVPRGRRVPERVDVAHLAATLLALAGVPARGPIAGANLLDRADLEELATRPVFATTRRRHLFDQESGTWVPFNRLHGVRDGDWLYAWSPREPDRPRDYEMLWNTARDPGENRDVAAGHPEVCARLRAEIESWLAAGAEARPASRMAGDADLELLRAIGYVGD